MTRLVPTLLLALLAAALFAGPATGAQVAYIDGGQVWVSTLDGSQKRSLSGPSPDAKQWTEVTQSDAGSILGVRREPGKQGYLNATTLWGPDGAVAGNGALTGKPGWSVNAYPVTLDLTPDGRAVVYGYSNSRLGGGGSFEAVFGTYAEGSTNWYIEPFDIEGIKSGTLVGNRVVGWSSGTAYVQRASGQPPYSKEFDPWFGIAGIWRVDVAATGTVVAIELEDGQVAMVPFAGLGAAPPTDGRDCMLPVSGKARSVSISQDGTSMAWQDSRGVVVAGTPVWFPSMDVTTCNLSRPPVVISASGEMPSIGNSTAATPVQAPIAKPGQGKGKPSFVKPPGSLKAAALKAGVTFKVKVNGPGKVSATGKVAKKLVAAGKTQAKKAGVVKVKLKATRAYRGKLGSLVGKKLKIRVSAGGKAATLTRKLG